MIVSVQALEPLLVPPITEANQHIVEQIEKQVDEILDAKHIDPGADISTLENEIDKLVYALYDLIPKEIAVMEGKV